MTSASIAAVLLASDGSRQSDRAIAALPHPDTRLVEHLVSVLYGRCDPIVIVAARGELTTDLNAGVLPDRTTGVGSLVSTARGLRAAAEAGASQALVCTVGMPYLDREFIDMLVARSKNLTADVILPWDGRDRHFPAVYQTSVIGQVDALLAAGERSMAALVSHVDTQRIVVARSQALTTVDLTAGLRVPVATRDEGHGEGLASTSLHGLTTHAVVDNRLALAYDAAEKTLQMQDTTLGNLRSRANNLLATAALFTTFSVGVGLIKTDPTKGQVLAAWKALILLGLLALLGLSVLKVLWAVENWAFGPSAAAILHKMDETPTPSEYEIRNYVIGEMNTGAAKNHSHLVAKQNAFKVAAVLLVIQVGVLVSLLVWWR